MNNSIIDWIKTLKRTFKNWFLVGILLTIQSNSFKVELREDGKTYNWNKIQVLNHLVAKRIQLSGTGLEIYSQENKVRFPYKNQMLTFYGYQQNGWVQNEMIHFEYYKLDFLNKVVLDVGANSGATSIYFAINGAKKVIAIEPMPSTYEYLRKNVKVNGLESFIQCINGAVWNVSNGEIEVGPDEGLGARIHFRDHSASKIKVPIVNLETLIKNLESNIVIKMDCEGCEYKSLINLEPDVLLNIDQIMLEYHNGWQNIIMFLEENSFAAQLLNNPRKSIGMIYAKRITETSP